MKAKSEYLGRGMASKAGKMIEQRKQTQGERVRNIMQEIQNTRGGAKNYKNCGNC